MIDLWYDYPNGRNLNLIRKQLGSVTHDVEYTNGTSYYYDLEAGTCKVVSFPVGILRPDWLNNATYVGVEEIDGFKCNVWEKVDFIRYWEDIETQRPVSWLFTHSSKLSSPYESYLKCFAVIELHVFWSVCFRLIFLLHFYAVHNALQRIGNGDELLT